MNTEAQQPTLSIRLDSEPITELTPHEVTEMIFLFFEMWRDVGAKIECIQGIRIMYVPTSIFLDVFYSDYIDRLVGSWGPYSYSPWFCIFQLLSTDSQNVISDYEIPFCIPHIQNILRYIQDGFREVSEAGIQLNEDALSTLRESTMRGNFIDVLRDKETEVSFFDRGDGRIIVRFMKSRLAYYIEEYETSEGMAYRISSRDVHGDIHVFLVSDPINERSYFQLLDNLFRDIKVNV